MSRKFEVGSRDQESKVLSHVARVWGIMQSIFAALL